MITQSIASILMGQDPLSDVVVSSKSENRSEVMLTVEQGEVYWIWQRVRPGVLYARVILEEITEEEGQEKIKKCKPAK